MLDRNNLGIQSLTSMSTKGQVVVPQMIRRRLGLREGDQLEFVNENGRIYIEPYRGPENPFLKYVGALPAFDSVAAVNQFVSDLRDED
jgi:AbrB family looped-hinge helix DNA binding protein